MGRCISLTRAPARIGRDLDNEIVLEDSGVSRRHARIERLGQHVVLMDVGSTYGTYLNDVELSGTAYLQTGDRIKVGSTMFKFFSGSDPDAELHEQIYRTAITDELTNLANKRYFAEGFAREFSRAQRHARPLSLLVIDIDHFKRVNDAHGHHVGDLTLRAVADAVSSNARSNDLAARYGGEELVVLLPETSITQALALAERLRAAIAACVVRYRDATVSVTVSIGCAERRESDSTPDDLFDRADRQAYAAKDAGRNRVSS